MAETDLAAALYGPTTAPATTQATLEGAPLCAAESVAAPSAAPAPDAGTPAPVSAAPTSVDDLVNRELDAADILHADGGQLFDGLLAASTALDAHFNPLRVDGDEADRTLLQEGQKAAAELLTELSVPQAEAREIASTLGHWHGQVVGGYVMDTDTMTSTGDKAEAELRQAWGKDYSANVELAKRVARQAEQRMPWLKDMIASTPLGNDARFIRRLAEIGLRQARRARR